MYPCYMNGGYSCVPYFAIDYYHDAISILLQKSVFGCSMCVYKNILKKKGIIKKNYTCI